LNRLESSSGDEKDSVSSATGKHDVVINDEDKKKLESSLNDLCLRLKAVSQRNVQFGDGHDPRGQRGFSEGPAGDSLVEGAMTPSIMTRSITALSITTLSIN
jgi:hypothetical protein